MPQIWIDLQSIGSWFSVQINLLWKKSKNANLQNEIHCNPKAFHTVQNGIS